MEYHSAIKRNEIGSFVVMWMNLESVIHSEKQTSFPKAYMWNRDTDTENGHLDKGEGWDELGE